LSPTLFSFDGQPWLSHGTIGDDNAFAMADSRWLISTSTAPPSGPPSFRRSAAFYRRLDKPTPLFVSLRTTNEPIRTQVIPPPPAAPVRFHTATSSEKHVAEKKYPAHHTRFPAPDLNGYLHIGHPRASALELWHRREFGGVCNLRMGRHQSGKETSNTWIHHRGRELAHRRLGRPKPRP